MIITDSSVQHYARLLRRILAKISPTPRAVIPKNFLEDTPFIFDFTSENKTLSKIDLRNTTAFNQYITGALNKAGRMFGIGRYGENRTLYNVSPLFTSGGEPRSVHLGVDLWVPAGTPIFAPLPATVHSFQINDHFLDYGPTIILEHHLENAKLYTLYGHLSRTSLEMLAVGQNIKAGEMIAAVGKQDENGCWPTHLHFQIITDLLGYKGDFPGVAKESEKEDYLLLCPDPNLLLHLKGL